MSLALYMDVHVRRAITVSLLDRGVDILTAQADASAQLDDSDLLDRATSLGRVLFSQDEDLLAEATRRQRGGVPFAGIVYAHQLYVTVGRCINDLELIRQSRYTRGPRQPRSVSAALIYLARFALSNPKSPSERSVADSRL